LRVQHGELAAAPRPPILVTGSHRSGSTWVGSMLGLAPGTGYVHEPFHRRCRPGICRAGFPHWFQYVHDGDPAAAHYHACLADTLAWRYSPGAQLRGLGRASDLARMLRDMAYFEARRRRGDRVVMKDPIAFFSAEWLARSFGMTVVVLIRHPAAFVASLKAAVEGPQPDKWIFRYRDFLGQEALMAGALAPFRDEIEAMARHEDDVLRSGILLWRIVHHRIAAWRAAHPDWIFLRHEDLSRDPEAGFGALYARLGLDFTEPVRSELRRYTGAAAPARRLELYDRAPIRRDSRATAADWRRRLAPEEVAAIRRATEPEASGFYGEAEW
jgi:Sulfotransferase family